MTILHKELVFLILQFLEEEGFKEAARELERNSGYFFNMEHFEELVLKGDWVGAEKYLSGFTKFDDNKYSTKIYFEMRKHNYLEALDNNDRAKAIHILDNDLKVFSLDNKDLFNEMTQLLTLNNIREHESLSTYGDTETARTIVVQQLKKIIRANPIFHGKVDFPCIKTQRLRSLLNQSLNWQHLQCKNPQPNPDMRTLFVDHVWTPPHEHIPFLLNAVNPQCTSASVTSTVSNSGISGSTLYPVATTDHIEESDFASKRPLSQIADKETQSVTPSGQGSLAPLDDLCENHMGNTVLGSHQRTNIIDLPKKVVKILTEDSSQTSMEFHPVQHTLLLVGTSTGYIGLWEVASGEKLFGWNFKVWNISACTMVFKTALLKDPQLSVNRTAWSPDGSIFGVAYSKHIVQMYAYYGGNDVRQQLEIDAHVGSVNDLAFAAPHKQLLVITCGDDRRIQAWDIATGGRIYSFEGHHASVYSLCPRTKNNTHFFFSTSVDGNIKAWLYDYLGPRVNYNAPGRACTSMAYTTDGQRLLSCGTSNSGESFLVEWDESQGAIKRSYRGLQKSSVGAVKFDIMKNQFVAAGNENVIKVWNLDGDDLLTTIDAEGGLPENPQIRFNKDGTLLAVYAKENKIKVLASDSGLQLLGICGSDSDESSRVVGEKGDTEGREALNSKLIEEANAGKSRKPFESYRHTQCQSLLLPSNVKVEKISRLIYGSAGNAALALASNGIHLLWKWPVNDLNLTGQVTAKVPPELLKRRNSSTTLMKNDLTANTEAVPCFALSKNDCYLISSSGAKISIFNTLTFKTVVSFMPPSSEATCLAFHPIDNNIVAIGSADFTVLVHNVRLNETISVLDGHTGRISGLAFSNTLNILVSTGADAQIIVWDAANFKRQRSRSLLEIPEGLHQSDTYVQFHPDQTQLLAVHKSYMGILVANNLECVAKWIPGDSPPISGATFSCDGQKIYAAFMDGTVGIFASSPLEFFSWISLHSYLPSSSSLNVYPAAIAAHPQKPNQFAVGLTGGEVVVIEPPSPGTEW
ncbi:unnamed protein product [Linum tenue]|uniref:CTLH domain-containing protein n=1 Tax=Linum tenue TaxID=586396 RepID=A0AAV0MDJ4_9ROSI|nr:unnamed protein product [Linum tenue]